MNTEVEKAAAPTRNLSGKTVLVVFGIVGLILTIIWWVVGGWCMALTVPGGILGFLIVMVLFRFFWERIMFPIIGVTVLGISRLIRGLGILMGKKH